MATKIFQFGALAPTSNQELVEEQFRRAHKYKNALTEMELRRRMKCREAMAEHPDTAPLQMRKAALSEELDNLRVEINRIKARRRANIIPIALKTRAEDLKRELREVRDAIKAARAAVIADVVVKQKMDDASQQANEERKAARAECGCYWGTYLLVEDSADQARKGHHDPRFKGWTGDGRLGVQIQNGFSLEEFGQVNTRAWMPSPPPEAFERRGEQAPPGEGRRTKQRTVLHLRIGSEGRNPIWTTVPVMAHRPFPKDARVKWVVLGRRRIADTYRWRVDVIVDFPDQTTSHASKAKVGIDVGWRLRPNGDLRVAYSVDDDGVTEELRLPAALLSKQHHTEQLRSVRDKHYDAIKVLVAAWLRASTPEGVEVKAADVEKWRSPKHMVRLLRAHSDRIPADLVTQIEQWHRHDRHLWQWEAFERRQVGHRRREIYRQWARKVVDRYGVIAIEKFDLREVAKRDEPEEGSRDPRSPNWQRSIACLSDLRLWLNNAAKTSGTTIIKVPCAYTTMTCHGCANVEHWDHGKDLSHTCSKCDLEWDQDYNAALNILASASAPSSGGEARVAREDVGVSP